MKRILGISLAFLLLSATGVTALAWSHVDAGLTAMKHWVEGLFDSNHHFVRAESMLRDRRKLLAERRIELKRLEASAERSAAELRALHEQAKRLDRHLRRARELLASSRDRFTIHGQEYTRAEIERDALVRAARKERIVESIARKQTAQRAQRAAIQKCRRVLAEAEQSLENATNELAVLRTRSLANEQVRETQGLVQAFTNRLASRESDLLEGVLDELRNRVERDEILARETGGSDLDTGPVDWDGNPQPPLDVIERALAANVEATAKGR